MENSYVEKRDDGYWIASSRVSLDSIVYGFWSGQTAESIKQDFPVLTLEEVYGAIAYYLAHRHEIDGYLQSRHHDYESRRQAARDADPAFYQKITEAKRKLETARF